MEHPMGYGSRVTVTGNKGQEPLVGGAILKIESGKKTDLQFHLHTSKIFYVLAGKLKVSVMRNASLHAIEVPAGNAFAVNKGLVYQMEGLEDSTVVEFTSRPENYLVEGGKMVDDVTVIAKGTELPAVEKSVEAKAEEVKEKAEEVAVETKPKTTKKKPARKKTTKKKTN